MKYDLDGAAAGDAGTVTASKTYAKPYIIVGLVAGNAWMTPYMGNKCRMATLYGGCLADHDLFMHHQSCLTLPRSLEVSQQRISCAQKLSLT